MPKEQIVRIHEDDGSFLSYDGEYGRTGTPIESSSVTLEELADFCDQNAVSANNHEFVGSHRILAALLHRSLGRTRATEVLKEIAEYGGLDGMAGVGWRSDAFLDFGIKDCWHDWKLP